MLLAIFLLLGHAIDRLENLLHQQFVAIQHGVQHRQPLCMCLGNALIQTLRGNLHQQRRLLILVWQIEIMPHHRLHDKRPVQMIGSCHSPARHQMVLFAANHHRLRQFVILCVSIEQPGLRIDTHLRISTHIHRSVEPRLQKSDVEAELILIGTSRRII